MNSPCRSVNPASVRIRRHGDSLVLATAAERVESALAREACPASSRRETTFHIGLFNEPGIAALLESAGIDPDRVQHDGYALGWSGSEDYVITAHLPRGLVYACGYELPRMLDFHADATPTLPLKPRHVSPRDPIRGFRSWTEGGEGFIARAACELRLNPIWLSTHAILEAEFPDWPELASFVETHAIERARRRLETERMVRLAHDHGLEIYVGGSYQLWHLPDDLYGLLCRTHPELVEGLQWEPGSPWPPALWTDRPRFCFCRPLVRKFFRDIVDEFLRNHPEADGFGIGFGYDGYPFAASCPNCRGFRYADRLREQAELVYDVVVKQHRRKLILWTWAGGPLMSVPGHDAYYGWLPEFTARDAEHIITAAFAVTGDFNAPYPLNPKVGTRSRQDCGLLLTWHDYRGDSAVPASLAPWMERSLPRLREQGAAGFFAMEAWPHLRLDDPVHAAELDAFGRFTWDDSLSAEEVTRDHIARRFSVQAAKELAPLLAQTGEIVDRALFMPSGHRLARHCEPDDHLRRLWDVSVLMDSAPFFLDEEARRRLDRQDDPVAFLAHELRWLSDEPAVAATLRWRDESVDRSDRLLAAVEEAGNRYPEDRETLAPLALRCRWLTHYCRLFRGYTRAILHLKKGTPGHGSAIHAGVLEMREALQNLPGAKGMAEAGVHPFWNPDGPWHLVHPTNFFASLDAAATLLDAPGDHRIALVGDPTGRDYLESLFLRYDDRPRIDATCLRASHLVLGSDGIRQAATDPGPLLAAVRSGTTLLLHHASPDTTVPLTWLPGRVQLFAANLTSVTVRVRGDLLADGGDELRPEPVSVRGKAPASPSIPAFVEATAPWRTDTSPGVLHSCRYGHGRIILNLVPANRALFLRCLSVTRDPATDPSRRGGGGIRPA